MRGRDDVGCIPCLLERAFLEADDRRGGERVHHCAQPPEPDEDTGVVRPGREGLGELLEQRQRVGTALARRLVEIRGQQEPARRRSSIALRRQLGGALGEHGRGLRRSTCVDPGCRGLELGRDRLASRARAPTDVDRPFVRIHEHVREPDGARRAAPRRCGGRARVDASSGCAKRSLPERSSTMPDTCSSSTPPRWRLAEDVRIEPPQGRRDGRRSSLRLRQRRESRAKGGGQGRGRLRPRVSGRSELERVVRAATGQLLQAPQLGRA